MLLDLGRLLAPSFTSRLTLLLNHVLSREGAAMERLRGHVGAVVQVVPERAPAWLPPPPPLSFRVTPAGLLESLTEDQAPTANLRVRLDVSNPAALGLGLLSDGSLPPMQIEGDSRLAADIDWLAANVRWDIADDLDRLFGPVPAMVLTRVGRGLRQALAMAMQGAADLKARWRPPA